MFRNIFKIRPKKFLGIDVGTSSIRIVEIGRRGQTYKLINYGEAGLSFVKERPFRVYRKDTLLLSNKKIAKTVQAIFKEAGIQTKEVNFSIPDFCSFSTSFELPPMNKEEIPEAVRYEVRPHVPLPLSEITLDWTIIEGEITKTSIKVLVVAIPNDVISQYQEIAHLSNLNLKLLEPEVFALARSLVKSKERAKIIGLIDIGARSTTCNVLEKGILKTSHSFNTAGNELTEIIARSLNMDYNKAEELKKKFGLISNNEDNDNKKDVRKTIIPLIDSVIEEVKKIFRDFYQSEGKEVEKIVLAGGSALMPGLKEYFSAELNKKVVIADPFSGVACPQVLSDALKAMGPSYAIAIGAALKGLE